MSLKSLIEGAYWEELSKEGITKDCLKMVVIDIAYSPVIAVKNEDPVNVVKQENGKYRIDGDSIFNGRIIDENSLKVMRYRYLINKNKQF